MNEQCIISIYESWSLEYLILVGRICHAGSSSSWSVKDHEGFLARIASKKIPCVSFSCTSTKPWAVNISLYSGPDLSRAPLSSPISIKSELIFTINGPVLSSCRSLSPIRSPPPYKRKITLNTALEITDKFTAFGERARSYNAIINKVFYYTVDLVLNSVRTQNCACWLVAEPSHILRCCTCLICFLFQTSKFWRENLRSDFSEI